MEEYRAYVIGSDGHITSRIDIRCADEKEARRLAKPCCRWACRRTLAGRPLHRTVRARALGLSQIGLDSNMSTIVDELEKLPDNESAWREAGRRGFPAQLSS